MSEDTAAFDPWLTSDEARRWIDALRGEPLEPLVRLKQLRGVLPLRRAAWIVEQLELAGRAEAKFADAATMFFTRQGLEQATDGWVAHCKATRFPAGAVVADMCCGIGGDLRALAARGPVLGVDRNRHVATLAAANLPGDSTTALVAVAEAATLHLASADCWHCDPDRRADGRRSVNLARHDPPLEQLDRWLAQAPHAGIKLAPAAEVPPQWQERVECEWFSRHGQCRQLVAWFGKLAQNTGQRRATIVGPDGRPTVSIAGCEDRLPPVADRVQRYLFEPDPAVLAAGLQGTLAQQLELAALAPGVAYLTGEQPLDHPALDGFEVCEVLPLDLRKLRAWIREHRIGRLELKKRGVPVDLDRLRRQLPGTGDQAATLVIAPHAGRTLALVVQRITVCGHDAAAVSSRHWP